jgi:hypothetical protein
LLLGLAGCRGLGQPSQAQGNAVPLTIDCQTAYRSSVTVGIEQESQISIVGDTEQTATIGDFEFRLYYTDGLENWESRSLRLAVAGAGLDQELTAQLYQLPKDALPQNQFIGGHGFTGLAYVYHPDSGAELQYWCVAR